MGGFGARRLSEPQPCSDPCESFELDRDFRRVLQSFPLLPALPGLPPDSRLRQREHRAFPCEGMCMHFPCCNVLACRTCSPEAFHQCQSPATANEHGLFPCLHLSPLLHLPFRTKSKQNPLGTNIFLGAGADGFPSAPYCLAMRSRLRSRRLRLK